MNICLPFNSYKFLKKMTIVPKKKLGKYQDMVYNIDSKLVIIQLKNKT